MKDEASVALERYLKLAEEVTSPQDTATLILSATGDPNLHVFGELLDSPKVASLEGTTFQSFIDLLRLFAYNSFADYANNKSKYPTITPAHERKLRRLSVVSLANQASSVSYDSIRNCLRVSSVREVEDAVLDAVYAGLLRARLDQRAESVEVLSAAGRDLPPQTGIPEMLTLLERWSDCAQNTVSRIIDTTVGSIQSASANAARERISVEKDIAAVRISVLGPNSDAAKKSMGDYPSMMGDRSKALRSRMDS